jgi:hypothetical protein
VIRIVKAQDVFRLLDAVRIGAKEECWEWQKGKFSTGYGAIVLSGQQQRAHRVAYELANGPIQDGMFIRHLCHNRACCNPHHLRVGTHKDNMEDMAKAKRAASGEQNGSSKLTQTQVEEIKKLLAKDVSHSSIAKTYGVSSTLIGYIRRGRLWSWVR